MRFLTAAVFLSTLLVAALAAAEPAKVVAPSLGRATVRARADATLDALVDALPTDVRERLTGTYVAVDPDESDPYTLASCDDDGDHVVVISQAMLDLVARVAEAAAGEDVEVRLSAYARALARQPRDARLVPPPPGFYDGARDQERESKALGEALAGLVGHELAHLARGHLVCAHPTPQRETGDAVWTADERAFAFRLAPRLYDAQHLRDADATTALWPSTRGDGYAAVLRVMGAVESAATTPFSYLRLHPGAAGRASAAIPAAAPKDAGKL